MKKKLSLLLCVTCVMMSSTSCFAKNVSWERLASLFVAPWNEYVVVTAPAGPRTILVEHREMMEDGTSIRHAVKAGTIVRADTTLSDALQFMNIDPKRKRLFICHSNDRTSVNSFCLIVFMD